MISTPYEFLAVRNFEVNLNQFKPHDKEKIKEKIREMLSSNPYRYEMLTGIVPLSGLNLRGLHRMKVGVSGLKGGAYILYRICEECKKNQYMSQSDSSCQFCDDGKGRHVVLFDVNPRSKDYGR